MSETFTIPQSIRDSLNLYPQVCIHRLEALRVEPITNIYISVYVRPEPTPLRLYAKPTDTHMVLGRVGTSGLTYLYGSYPTQEEANLVLTTLEILRCS